MMKVKTSHQDFDQDSETKVFLGNDSSFAKYQKAKQESLNNRTNKKELKQLKSEMSEIKNMLKTLLDGIKND